MAETTNPASQNPANKCPEWENPSGRNGKHAKPKNEYDWKERIRELEDELAELKANCGSKKDKNECKRHLKHLWSQLHETGTEHSRIAKNIRQRNRK